MPLILGAIGLGLGAAGTGVSLWSQNEAKKAAKKAEKENRKTAAWNALMQAAAGAVPQNDFRASAEPQVDYGGALATMGGGVAAFGNAVGQNDYKNELLKIKQGQAAAEANQQGIANQFEGRRIAVDEGRAAEQARANKATLDAQWNRDMQKASEGRSDFMRTENRDAADQDYRSQVLQIQRERTAAVASKEKATPGQLSEAELVKIATAKKEEDPIAFLVSQQMGKTAPSGYKSPDSARKRAIQLLQDRYGWGAQESGDLLGNSNDPMGLR